jgi:uncharacterized protein YjbJ (UPF0337 family)
MKIMSCAGTSLRANNDAVGHSKEAVGKAAGDEKLQGEGLARRPRAKHKRPLAARKIRLRTPRRGSKRAILLMDHPAVRTTTADLGCICSLSLSPAAASSLAGKVP